MLKGWRHCNTVGLNARQNVGILLYFSLPWFNADSLLFACFSSCLHHAVDESQSFIANDLIKTQRQTYAIRPTYPGQQLYKISILKRSHDWRWNVFFFSFFFFSLRGNCFVNIYLSHTPDGNVVQEVQLFAKCAESVVPVLHLIASFIHCKDWTEAWSGTHQLWV